MVANRVFKHTVVDLAWTPDGYHLIACSMDGTLAALHFDPGEPLGTGTASDQTWLLTAQAVGQGSPARNMHTQMLTGAPRASSLEQVHKGPPDLGI